MEHPSKLTESEAAEKAFTAYRRGIEESRKNDTVWTDLDMIPYHPNPDVMTKRRAAALEQAEYEQKLNARKTKKPDKPKLTLEKALSVARGRVTKTLNRADKAAALKKDLISKKQPIPEHLLKSIEAGKRAPLVFAEEVAAIYNSRRKHPPEWALEAIKNSQKGTATPRKDKTLATTEPISKKHQQALDVLEYCKQYNAPAPAWIYDYIPLV